MESGKRLKQLDSFTNRSDINTFAGAMGQKEIRIHNNVANDIMIMNGIRKIWNSFPPDVFEKIFVSCGLIPIGYYYSTFDVDTDELVFLSQENYVTKRIQRIRWNINFWFIKRGW